MLSDNSVGVSFNDGSRMFAFPDSEVFCLQRKVKYSDGKWRNEDKIYKFDNHPEEFGLKVKLFKKFRKYLCGTNIKTVSKLNPKQATENEVVFVKKWKKRR